jgi:hypothetical protein
MTGIVLKNAEVEKYDQLLEHKVGPVFDAEKYRLGKQESTRSEGLLCPGTASLRA